MVFGCFLCLRIFQCNGFGRSFGVPWGLLGHPWGSQGSLLRGLVGKSVVEVGFFSKPSSTHPSRRAKSVKIMVLPAREHDFQGSQGCQYGAKMKGKHAPKIVSSQKPKKSEKWCHFH